MTFTLRFRKSADFTNLDKSCGYDIIHSQSRGAEGGWHALPKGGAVYAYYHYGTYTLLYCYYKDKKEQPPLGKVTVVFKY